MSQLEKMSEGGERGRGRCLSDELVETHEIPVELEASSLGGLFDSPSFVEFLLSRCDHSESERRSEEGRSAFESRKARDEGEWKETNRFSSPVFFPVFFPSRIEFSI